MAELTGKTISELPEDALLTGDELLALMDGATAKRTALKKLLMLQGATNIDNGNIDEILDAGTYVVSAPSTIAGNPPTTTVAYKLFVLYTSLGGTLRVLQYAYPLGLNCIEYRRYYQGGTWYPWRTINPVEIGNAVTTVNTLNAALGGGNVSFATFSVLGGASYNLTLPSDKSGFIVVSSRSQNGNGLYTFRVSSDGTVYRNALFDASNLTFTDGTNTTSIANAANTWQAFGFVVFY